MKTIKHSIIAAATVLVIGLSGPATSEEGPFPVWWSPMLELESLDQIDARLERELWKGGSDGMPLFKHEG